MSKKDKDNFVPADLIDPDSDKEIEKLFGDHIWGKGTWKSKFIRNFWLPLWYISQKEFRGYRFYKLPKHKRLAIVKKLAENIRRSENYSNLPPVTEVIGRDKEISIFLNSIYYHILRNPVALKQKKPPPKVFLVKGEPGSGKSWVIQAAAKEAFDRAVEEGFILNFTQLEASQITGMYMGQLTAGASAAFDRASKMPTFLHIDEAQNLFQKGSAQHGDSASREYQAAESAMLLALDRIIKRPVRTIVVLSSNTSENIREDVRRRCYLMDLDTPGLGREDMTKIVGRFLKRMESDLDPEKVLTTLEQELRGLGHGKIVPHDIDRAFDEVVSESEKPIQEAFLKKLEGADIKALPIDLDSFKRAAPKVRAYKEQELVGSVKEAEQTVPPPERYADIGGLKDIKDTVIKEITLSLHPEKAGPRWKSPRGYLFKGGPGTGKTLLAKSIAGENKVPFFVVKGPSLFRPLVGETEMGVRQLFARARAKSPSMIFMDEIDAIGRVRGATVGDAGVQLGALTTLLSELDGFDPKGKVVFIGSTNRPDQLDPALLERLDKQFEFTYPKTTEEKLDIIKAQWRTYQSESEVTPEQIYRIFLKRSFSPRKSADTIAEASRYSQLESIACHQLLEALATNDSEESQKTRTVYKDEFKRIQDKLFSGKGKALSPEFDINVEYKKVAEYNPITLLHLEKAFEKVADTEEDKLEREMSEIHRVRESLIGKGYGLATDTTGVKGIFLTIECVIFPAAKKGEGTVEVLGNVGVGMKESAQIARNLLRKYCPRIKDLDIEVHVISHGEGGETVSVSGPSAGQAMLFTMLSALIMEPFNHEVCMTGKVDFSGIAGLVGGIQPKKGTGKLDAARENGFKFCLIPRYAYDELAKDFPDYLDMSKEIGTEIVGEKDWEGYAKYVFPRLKFEQILAKLNIVGRDAYGTQPEKNGS